VAAEIEVFVHGALCISYSGRCMLSSYMTGRDANQGHCAHPCRYQYALVEEKRPGEYFPVHEDQRGTYIFNSKDLCLLDSLPELVAAGVDSLKIEGRMKSIFYVGGVVRVYRAALDYLKKLEPERWKNPKTIQIPKVFVEELEKTGTRGMSRNFLRSRPGPEDMLYNSSRLEQEYEPVGVIRELGPEGVGVELRNVCSEGERVEYMGRSLACPSFSIGAMRTAEGKNISRGNPGNYLYWQLEKVSEDLEVNGMFRRKKAVQLGGGAT
jgi:putative protease